VPALDLPGLDVVATARAFGCIGVTANTTDEIKKEFAKALKADGPTVIGIPVARQERALVAE
jgi:benzoylformate decarboxylase